MFCREQVAQFEAVRDQIDAAGVKLVFVGNGTALMAADFASQFNVQSPVFTDPSRKSYRILGMKRNFGLGLKSLARGRRAMNAGHRQGATRGDPWQQGGVVLLSPEGEVLWSFISDSAGHHPEVAEVLAALPR